MAAPATSFSVIPEGPFGNPNGGGYFYDGVGEIYRITVTYSDDLVNSPQTIYRQTSMGFCTSQQHGSNGPKTQEIDLMISGERLIQVKGTLNPAGYSGTDVVTSITFVTNKQSFGPYGTEKGAHFESRILNPRKDTIVGFLGRSGLYIDAIGMFRATEPLPPVVLSARFGGSGGSPWYEGRSDKISIITVKYDNSQIGQIEVTFYTGGTIMFGAKHGDESLSKSITIKLKDNEYVVHITGTHGPAPGVGDMVLSLQFIANKARYGPFGNITEGTPFETASTGRIVGLVGRSGGVLDQIGAIIDPTPQPT